MKKLKKLLNKFARWLYLKTCTIKYPSTQAFLLGLKVHETSFIPKGECIIGTGEQNYLKTLQVNDAISEDKPYMETYILNECFKRVDTPSCI